MFPVDDRAPAAARAQPSGPLGASAFAGDAAYRRPEPYCSWSEETRRSRPALASAWSARKCCTGLLGQLAQHRTGVGRPAPEPRTAIRRWRLAAAGAREHLPPDAPAPALIGTAEGTGSAGPPAGPVASGGPVLPLQRQPGVKRYETVWMMAHKLRRPAVNANRTRLAGAVEAGPTVLACRWSSGTRPGTIARGPSACGGGRFLPLSGLVAAGHAHSPTRRRAPGFSPTAAPPGRRSRRPRFGRR